MNRLEMLRRISFGAQVAEEETSELANYFVETDQWQRIRTGEIDIIRGDKGSGKSAIYSLLINKTDDLFDSNILLISAERARGATVFSDLKSTPPTSEIEFISLWKLYIATLIAQKIREFDLGGSEGKNLVSTLIDQGLLNEEHDLARMLRGVSRYVRSWFHSSIEPTATVDATGSSTTFSIKITPTETDTAGKLSVDDLLAMANSALNASGRTVWILLDRLDVAFVDSHELEANALRALFRVYRDLDAYPQIRLKIFLRVDIWNRITKTGFREASHITRFVTLEWSDASLLNLIIRRVLSNSHLLDEFKIDKQTILANFDSQRDLFYQCFPAQVEQGTRKRATLEWIISRCADAAQRTAPREVIHLLTSLREQEIARLERGESPPPSNQLFDRAVFKLALPKVSEARLVQNLYAEYPQFRPFLEKLRNQRTEQTLESLSQIWSVNSVQTSELTDQLVEIGFFQHRRERSPETYWIPFLYRDALQLSQGLAEE